MKLYASLVNSLNSIYYPVPADDAHTAQLMMANSSLSLLWCSIYTEAEADGCIERFGGIKLPDRFATLLDYDHDGVVARGGKPISDALRFALAFGGDA